MTELETMIRAESYIRKMADGITRCLYYVSDILRQVIDNDGVIKKKSGGSGKKAEFFITDEQRAALTEFDRPAYASELADKINAVTEINNCKKFAAKWVTEYFVSIGLLCIDDDSKRATEAGAELGIISEKRRSSYTHIESIVVFAKSSQYKQQTHPDSTGDGAVTE